MSNAVPPEAEIVQFAQILRGCYRKSAGEYNKAIDINARLHRSGVPYGGWLSREEVQRTRIRCEQHHANLRALGRLLIEHMPELADICPLIVSGGEWHTHGVEWDRAEAELLSVEVRAAHARIHAARPQDETATALSEIESRVLKRIAESSILVKGPDAIVDVKERAGKNALVRLESVGLIHRPRGDKSGYRITPAGKSAIS